jgi:hypothetical protein
MSILSTMYLEHWTRQSNTLMYHWDMMDFERQEQTRTEWKGTAARISPVTG